MANIEFRYYDNIDDYSKYRYKGKRFDHYFRVNKKTLKRCAVVVGKTSWASKEAPDLAKWRMRLIDAFFKDNKKTNKINIKNERSLEQSEKNIVGYLLGMIYAQAFAQCVLGVRYTLHLKNEEVYVKKKGEKSPDLCGYNKAKNRAFIFEAKGSTVKSAKHDIKVIDKACEQLDDVYEVEFTHISHKFNKNSLTKLAIGTHPNNKGEMELEIVDPIQENSETLTVDSDLMVLKYYFQLYSIIKKSYELHLQPTSLKSNYKIVYLKEESTFIGMLSDIYNFLAPYYEALEEEESLTKTIQYSIYSEVEKILDKWDDSNRPIYIDGKRYIYSNGNRKVALNQKNIQGDKKEEINREIEMKINNVVYENIYEDFYENVSIGIDGTILYTNLDELKEIR